MDAASVKLTQGGHGRSFYAVNVASSSDLEEIGKFS